MIDAHPTRHRNMLPRRELADHGGGAECVELALSGACIKEMDAYLGIFAEE